MKQIFVFYTMDGNFKYIIANTIPHNKINPEVIYTVREITGGGGVSVEISLVESTKL